MNTDDLYAQALAALDQATAAPLPNGEAVVYLPGSQPLIITAQTAETWASAAWPELAPQQITVLAARLVEIAAPLSNSPARFSISVDAQTLRDLETERERIAASAGLRKVSLNNVINRLLRAGLAAERP
jgi:hypothetical protein